MVMVRHRNGILQEMSPEDAERLLKAGVIEMAGAVAVSPVETAMLAPVETAMLPAAQPRKRGRARKVQG